MAEKAKKKPNALKRVGTLVVRFLRDTKGEMKKVVWPTRKQALNNFLVVMGFVLVCAVLIGVLDFVFGGLFALLAGLAGGAAA